MLRDTVAGFIQDDALSRGASIAYYTLFSLAPIPLITIAGELGLVLTSGTGEINSPIPP